MGRKSHTKSRNGCLECKKRRTKCDERRPKCSTCNRLGQACTYKDPLPTPPNGPSLPTKTNDLSLILNSPSRENTPLSQASNSGQDYSFPLPPLPKSPPPPPPPLAIDDLKLLHHFLTYAYATLDFRPERQQIWLDCVIPLGFKHPFVLQGVLSISALHLATLLPAQAQTYMAHSSTQYNRALTTFRVALQNANFENYKAVYMFSCITVLHALAVAQIQKPEDPVGDLIGCMHLVQGVMVVLTPFQNELHNSEFGPTVRPDLLDSDDNLVQIPPILALKSLIAPSMEMHNTTEDALDLLHLLVCKAHADTIGEPYVHYMLCWPALLSSGFLQDLSKKEPVSMIMLAHFAAVLGVKGVTETWFVARWNTYIFDAVEAMLEPDVKKWMDWPRAVMEQGRIVLS